MNKRDHKIFQREVIKFLKSVNTKEVNGIYKYELETKVGKLSISLGEHYPFSKMYWIYTRFENPVTASKYFNCDKYNGKWNFYSYDYKDVLETFKDNIEEVISLSKENQK